MNLAIDLREDRYSLLFENPIVMDPANDKIPTERFCGIVHVSFTEKTQLYVRGRNGNINDERWTESCEQRNAYILFSNFDKSPIPNELKPIKFDVSSRFSGGDSNILATPNPTAESFEEYFHITYSHGFNERLSIFWPATIKRHTF